MRGQPNCYVFDLCPWSTKHSTKPQAFGWFLMLQSVKIFLSSLQKIYIYMPRKEFCRAGQANGKRNLKHQGRRKFPYKGKDYTNWGFWDCKMHERWKTCANSSKLKRLLFSPDQGFNSLLTRSSWSRPSCLLIKPQATVYICIVLYFVKLILSLGSVNLTEKEVSLIVTNLSLKFNIVFNKGRGGGEEKQPI